MEEVMENKVKLFKRISIISILVLVSSFFGMIIFFENKNVFNAFLSIMFTAVLSFIVFFTLYSKAKRFLNMAKEVELEVKEKSEKEKVSKK